MTIRTWTHEELEMLAQHKVPQGRSLNAARIKACSLGIRFRPNEGAPANTTPVWTPAKPTYTEDELESLKNGVLPEGRSLSGAYNKAFRMGTSFATKRRRKTPQKEKVALLKADIVKELQARHSIRSTAIKFGLAYTSVRNIAVELGLVA